MKVKKGKFDFSPTSLIDMLVLIGKYEDAFFEIKRLVKIACIILVTSAEAERSFSIIKLIKTHVKTSMNDSRLSNITVLSVHKKRAKEIDLERVIDEFVKIYPNCRIMLK